MRDRTRRNLRRHLVRAACATAIAVAGSLTVGALHAATLSDFSPSHVQGGGMTVVTSHPNDPDLLVAGGDNSGIHVSEDGGVTWRARNYGLDARGELSIAAIVFATDTREPRVFVAVGTGHTPDPTLDEESGVYSVSDITDFDEPWKPLTDGNGSLPAIAFSGEHNGDDLVVRPHPVYANREPRSTGNLLVYQPRCVGASGWCLFAGTFAQGVHLWWSESALPDEPLDDSHYDYKPLALAEGGPSGYIRSLAFDAAQDTLYAAAFHTGLHRLPLTDDGGPHHDPKTASVLCTSHFSHSAEELSLVDQTLYIAAGPAGAFRLQIPGSFPSDPESVPCEEIKKHGCKSDCNGPFWRSIAARTIDGQDRVVLGSVHPSELDDHTDVIANDPHSIACPHPFPDAPADTALQLQGGVAWSSLLTPATTNPCKPLIYGASPKDEIWWRGDTMSFVEQTPQAVSNQPGRSSYNAHYLHIAADGVLWIAGSAGVHRVESLASESPWEPAIAGLQGTQGMLVHQDPSGGATWYGMRDYFGIRWSPGSAPSTPVKAWTSPTGPTDALDEMTAIARSELTPTDVYFGALDTNVGSGPAVPYVLRCNDGEGLLSCASPLNRERLDLPVDTLCDDGAWQLGALAAYVVDAGGSNEREVLLAAVIAQKSLAAGGCEGLYRWDYDGWRKVGRSERYLARREKNFYSVSLVVDSSEDPENAYLYNRDTGLYRIDLSDDDIVGLPTEDALGGSPWTAEDKYSGYMQVDLGGGRIYVSRDDHACVYVVAGGGHQCILSPGLGPIALTDDPSRLVGVVSAANGPAKVCLFRDVDTHTPTRRCADGDLDYQNAVLFPTDLTAHVIDSTTVGFTVTSLTGGFYTGRLNASE